MKSGSTKRIAASVLVALIASFVFQPVARAGAGNGSGAEIHVSSDALAADIEYQKEAQLVRGNAAYLRGEYAEAFRQYRKVAVLGVPEAHYRLGLMCMDGLGTRKSARQAEYWLRLALAGKHPDAAAALVSLREMEGRG